MDFHAILADSPAPDEPFGPWCHRPWQLAGPAVGAARQRTPRGAWWPQTLPAEEPSLGGSHQGDFIENYRTWEVLGEQTVCCILLCFWESNLVMDQQIPHRKTCAKETQLDMDVAILGLSFPKYEGHNFQV